MARYKVAPKSERTADGIVFDSKGEMNRYLVLKLLEREGEIFDLELQPKFELQPAFRDGARKYWRPITYSADFSYTENGVRVVEDVKGHQTQASRLKERMLRYQHPEIDFRIVKAW